MSSSPISASSVTPEVSEIIVYAIKLAWTSETYEVHSWMLLLGVLRNEQSAACRVLQELGVEDIYGAWNEVLWALNVADGLEPRAFTAQLTWGVRAYHILTGAVRFAGWAGREQVHVEDLMLAFAASDVLAGLFPDVDLSFAKVKGALERASDSRWALPGWEDDNGAALSSQEIFL